MMPASWLVRGRRRTDCPECSGKGWEHFETSAGPEIERCDACMEPLGHTDEDAVRLHRIDCGCPWPENREDYGGEIFYGGRTRMPIATFDREA